jgi:hypothetical protein
MTARVAIDLNVRVRSDETYAGFEDVDGGLAPGDLVEVYERETGLRGSARVTKVDNKRQLVFLAVDWPSLRERPAEPDWLGQIVAAVRGIAEAVMHAFQVNKTRESR